MLVMGLSNSHDASCCIIEDGEIKVFIEEERLSRRKHAFSSNEIRHNWDSKEQCLPYKSMNYCLEVMNIKIDDLDYIVVSTYAKYISELIPIKDKEKIVYVPEPNHHLFHAFSSFFSSNFDNAVVLVVDGDGSHQNGFFEAESCYFFPNRSGEYSEIFKNKYSESDLFLCGLGHMYTYFSQIIGFYSYEYGIGEEGKTMGLAPYGDISKIHLLKVTDNQIDFSGVKKFFSDKGYLYFDEKENKTYIHKLSKNVISKEHKKLAYIAQFELEYAMLGLTKYILSKKLSDNLCISGGVALNSSCNQVLVEKSGFKNFYFLPVSNDAGLSIGASFFFNLTVLKREIKPCKNFYLGKLYNFTGLDFSRYSNELNFNYFDEEKLINIVTDELMQQKVIGWFQGRSEAGPRALGNRSIIASPQKKRMLRYINLHIKQRELFRPLAPSVLFDKQSQWFSVFDSDYCPYMLRVVHIRKEKKKLINAVTHVDLSARIQSVKAEDNLLFYKLIHKFYEKTGIPMILNTSFNIRGMPIVETIYDAIEVFLCSELDSLVIGNYLLKKKDFSNKVIRLVDDWENILNTRLPKTEKLLFKELQKNIKEKIKQPFINNNLVGSLNNKSINDWSYNFNQHHDSLVDDLQKLVFFLRRNKILDEENK